MDKCRGDRWEGKKHHQVRQREKDGLRPTMRLEWKKGRRKSKKTRERNRSNQARSGKKGETWELWGKLVGKKGRKFKIRSRESSRGRSRPDGK